MKAESTQNDGCERGGQETIKQEFREASDSVWDKQVRTALIYGKEIFACKTCLAFFNRDDGQHDHPSDQVYLLTKLCVLKNITSETSFFQALWSEAVALLPRFGKILYPRFATQHLQPPPLKQDASAEGSLPWLQARVLILEQSLQTATQTIKELHRENRERRIENDELLSQVLHMKSTAETIQWKSLQHLQQLQALLTPDFSPDTTETTPPK